MKSLVVFLTVILVLFFLINCKKTNTNEEKTIAKPDQREKYIGRYKGPFKHIRTGVPVCGNEQWEDTIIYNVSFANTDSTLYIAGNEVVLTKKGEFYRKDYTNYSIYFRHDSLFFSWYEGHVSCNEQYIFKGGKIK